MVNSHAFNEGEFYENKNKEKYIPESRVQLVEKISKYYACSIFR
jgi:hypothetical protein